jgi:hypothetical protein
MGQHRIHGFDVYRMYLAMKLHFTTEKFDYFQAGGKTNAKETTYQERNDFWFFETLAKKYTAQEIQELLLASFVLSEETQKVWIGDIKSDGVDRYLVWKKQMEASPTILARILTQWLTVYGARGVHLCNAYLALHSLNLRRPPGALKLLCKGQILQISFLICDQAIGLHTTLGQVSD